MKFELAIKKVLFCLLLATQFAVAQQSSKPQTYKFGCNGMEYIATSQKGMVIVSTFNAKSQIRQDIARKIYAMFVENKIKSNTSVTIVGSDAHVLGKCVIRKKDTLTTVNFYYEKVYWNTGLTEVYKKNVS